MKKIITLLTILILLTGCVKYDLNMGVKNDKSFTITIIDAIQGEYSETTDITEAKENYISLGYNVKKYSDGKYTGLELTKTFNSIDEVSSANCGDIELTTLLDKNINEQQLFKSSKTGTTTTYTATFTYDLTTDKNTTEETTDYSEYTDSMYFKYSISLPTNAKLISNNADNNINQTLTWNIKYGELKRINFSFSIDDKDLTIKNEDNKDNTNDNNDSTITNKSNNNTENNNIIDNENTANENINNQTSNNNNTSNNKNTSSTVILGLIATVLVLGIIAFKIRGKNSSPTLNKSMPHSAPPKNR